MYSERTGGDHEALCTAASDAGPQERWSAEHSLRRWSAEHDLASRLDRKSGTRTALKQTKQHATVLPPPISTNPVALLGTGPKSYPTLRFRAHLISNLPNLPRPCWCKVHAFVKEPLHCIPVSGACRRRAWSADETCT